MHLQCLLHSSINIVLNGVTTKEHLHWERPPRYIKNWNVAKERRELLRIHSSRRYNEFQIFAPRYHLRQMIPHLQTTVHCILNSHLPQSNNMWLFVCPMQCMALDRYKITRMYICLCVSVRNTYCARQRLQLLSDIPQIWNISHTSDNEDQVRQPVTPEVVNAHARQFTSSLAHF